MHPICQCESADSRSYRVSARFWHRGTKKGSDLSASRAIPFDLCSPSVQRRESECSTIDPSNGGCSLRCVQALFSTHDRIVKRICWIAVGAGLLDLVATLGSQPQSYWGHPATADTGYNAFHFLLSRGWVTYTAAQLIYLTLAFVVISVIPRGPALLVGFAIILGYCFGFAAWLDYVWHLGMAATFGCGIVLGAILSAMPFEVPVDQIKSRLRWVMAGAMLFDLTNTILGQPSSYWHQPQTANEGFWLSRYFLNWGFSPFLIYDVVGLTSLFFIVSVLPKKVGLIATWTLIFSYYFGASTWLVSRWELGWKGPLGYAIALSSILVWSVSCKQSARTVATLAGMRQCLSGR
jgi:hypothetical protein